MVKFCRKRELVGWRKARGTKRAPLKAHCSFYFGRDRDEPCKSFQCFQFEEGKIGDVDLSGVLAINVIDLYSIKAQDVLDKGGEGGLYISDKTTEEQRKYLETYFTKNIPGGILLKKNLGAKYVDISLEQKGNTFHVKMPSGEIKLSYTPGLDGKNPQRLENSIFGAFLSDLKICNTHFWNYSDFGENWGFKNRSGVIARFDTKGKSRDF